MKKNSRLMSLCLSLAMLFGALVLPSSAGAAYGDRITITGTNFYAGGQQIFMNGANTPWNSWNDFGGSFDYTWWDNHFQTLHNNGINSTRIWITCDGEVGININSSGVVSGATTAHWNNLDSLFQIAQNRGVYVMATLMSFDHFKNTHTNYNSWRNMLSTNANIDSYVNNYLIPFVNRYKNNPWLWSIDLMNEPDWVYEDAAAGQIAWARLQTYFAKAAVAIHQNSNILTTVGLGMVKYNSATQSGSTGNKISDAALQAQVSNTLAKVDFYSPHYYGWQDPYFGIPFYMTPTAFGIVHDRPVVIGESPALGSTGHTITSDFANAYTNGYAGVMPWTSNGVDANGSITNLGPATQAFRDAHYALVFPPATGDSAKFNFENNSLQSFFGRNGLAVSASTDRAYAGSYSLKMTSSATGVATYYAQLDNPSGLSANTTLTFRVWVPSGAAIASIQPYVQSNNWTWYGNYQTYASLTKNAWNTITLTIPSGAATPMKNIGVELVTTGAWSGSIYLDSIN
ncbi:carbohydrate binding domain-containing protein [Paenibacillus lignilyticus]|uniref:Cellulase family glycosylhydrolase n=1 Tax=Paenibacillus lignilyticus TaxID=1172615 RepID=A0ABS5CG05_9BACL|nr:carbohydrate binding domain-containing protein [Paenibacillus lignilyticus]MBP3964812.1 cellulase family glycosylhydrolase [Paenibacillus lignilyticus]